MRYDEFGRELPDDRPVEMPLGFRRPKPLSQLVQELVRGEMSRAAAAAGEETFEESDDFDTGEDEEVKSPYELDDDQESFRYVVDKPVGKEENTSTASSDAALKKGVVSDGGSSEDAGVVGSGVENRGSSVGANGKVRSAPRGEGGAA